MSNKDQIGVRLIFGVLFLALCGVLFLPAYNSYLARMNGWECLTFVWRHAFHFESFEASLVIDLYFFGTLITALFQLGVVWRGSSFLSWRTFLVPALTSLGVLYIPVAFQRHESLNLLAVGFHLWLAVVFATAGATLSTCFTCHTAKP